MATRLILKGSTDFRGLRPFNLRRDLPDVVDLVLLAFGNEPERAGSQSSQEDLYMLKYLTPFIWVSGFFSTQARDFFAGFVWEEDGKVVGNASVSRIGKDRARYLIGNVAVHPDYRRRGIARQLTMAAIDSVRFRKGSYVLLDVRADNVPAYDLYLDLGFRQFGGMTDLKLTGWSAASAEASKDYDPDRCEAIPLTFRPLNRTEWQPVYELAQTATSRDAQVYRPIREADFESRLRHGALSWLSQSLSRRKDYRLLALDGDRPAAYLEVSVRGIKLSHRIHTFVHPDYRGKVETALIAKAMAILRYHPWNSIWAEVSSDHLEQTEAFKKHGFKETITLHRLGLRL